MTKLLTSTWMTVPVGAVVYLAATVLFWKTPAPPRDAGQVERSASAADQKGTFWEFKNPEADQLIAELKTEKKALEKKEQQLNDLAVRLQAERQEINIVTQAVHQMQMDFDKNVLRVEEEETANLKKLAKVYANMAAESAAAIFAEMDDTSVVKIMLFMKEPETAVILEALAKKGGPEAKRVAGISERLRLSAYRPHVAK